MESQQTSTEPLDRAQFTSDERALWEGKVRFYENKLKLDRAKAEAEADEVIRIDRETESDPFLKSV